MIKDEGMGALANALYVANDTEALLALASENWPPVDEELPAGIGEACRNASIRYAEANRIDQLLWRARAMSAAVLTDARDTAAGLMIQAAYLAIDDANTGRGKGSERGYEQARLILEEIRRLLPDFETQVERPPFARLYHEKRAYCFLKEGTGGGRPTAAGERFLESAEAEYVLAHPLTDGDERGDLKVLGSLALVRYLRLADMSAEEIATSKIPFLEITVAIEAAAATAKYKDVENWAGTNADVMRRGDFVGWTPYDVQ